MAVLASISAFCVPLSAPSIHRAQTSKNIFNERCPICYATHAGLHPAINPIVAKVWRVWYASRCRSPKRTRLAHSSSAAGPARRSTVRACSDSRRSRRRRAAYAPAAARSPLPLYLEARFRAPGAFSCAACRFPSTRAWCTRRLTFLACVVHPIQMAIFSDGRRPVKNATSK